MLQSKVNSLWAALHERDEAQVTRVLSTMVIPQSEFDYADTGDVLMLSMVKHFLISQAQSINVFIYVPTRIWSY